MTQIVDLLIETPVDKVQVFTYDQAGNLFTETDRKGQVTQYWSLIDQGIGVHNGSWLGRRCVT